MDSTQDAWACDSCGHEGNKHDYCGNCGTPKSVIEQTRRWQCRKCGQWNIGKFCGQCGTALGEPVVKLGRDKKEGSEQYHVSKVSGLPNTDGEEDRKSDGRLDTSDGSNIPEYTRKDEEEAVKKPDDGADKRSKSGTVWKKLGAVIVVIVCFGALLVLSGNDNFAEVYTDQKAALVEINQEANYSIAALRLYNKTKDEEQRQSLLAELNTLAGKLEDVDEKLKSVNPDKKTQDEYQAVRGFVIRDKRLLEQAGAILSYDKSLGSKENVEEFIDICNKYNEILKEQHDDPLSSRYENPVQMADLSNVLTTYIRNKMRNDR